MSSGKKVALLVCFFVSGATSLVLQVAWSKELSYILGNTLYAVATVVASFMAGLGIGSGIAGRVAGRIRRPVLAYAVLQVVIAVMGAASIPVLRGTQPLFRFLYGSLDAGDWTFLLARFGVVAALVMTPVILMGMTLPIIVGAMARGRESYSLEAGVVYGVNTIGAVSGTWLAGFVLVPGLGLFSTTLVAAAADLAVAVAAFVLVRSIALGSDRSAAVHDVDGGSGGSGGATDAAGAGRERAIIAGVFLVSGALAMAYEVAWFRLLAMTMGPTVYAFSAMLGMFLLGVGAGSVTFARWATRTKLGGGQAMARLELLLGVTVLAGLLYMNRLPRWNADLFLTVRETIGVAGFAVSHIAVAGIVVLLPCLILGALFPATVRAFREAGGRRGPEASVGRLYVLNTLGGIFGTLVTGFYLLPHLGLALTLTLTGIASVVLGVLLTLTVGRAASAARVRRAVVGVAAAAVIVVMAPPMDRVVFNLGLYRGVYSEASFQSQRLYGSEIIYHAEGINCPVTVFRSIDGHAALHVTGKADASTQPADQVTQSLLGHLPALVSRSPRSAAVIGYGSGMTVASLLHHPSVESIDVLEIEQAVVDASVYFDCLTDDPLDEPRVNLIVEDGRVHLTYGDAAYDVIVSEPSNPWMAGVSNLFTMDFYETVRSRLTSGGVFAQWIQAYDISPGALAVVLGSLSEVFPHVVLFKTAFGDFLAMASSDPIEVPYAELIERFDRPAVRESLERIGFDHALQLAMTFYGPQDALASIVRTRAARNTDDNVWLEYRMPLDLIGVGWDSHEELFPVRLAPDRLLAGFAAIVPGLPYEECAERLVEKIFSWQPTRAEPRPTPLWEMTRAALIDGLRAGTGAFALPRLDDWVRRGQSAVDLRARAAFTLLEAGRRGLAADTATLDRIVAVAPDVPMAWIAAADAHLAAGNEESARSAYQKVLAFRSSPDIPRAWIGLARLAASSGDATEAERLYRLAMHRDPYDPRSFHELATLLATASRRDDAAAVVRRARLFHPRNPLFRPGTT